MKKIINDKFYDTKKAEVIFEFVKVFTEKLSLMPGYVYRTRKPAEFLKTKKGTYLLFCKDAELLEIVNKKTVMETVKRLDAEKYQELFGKVEEG